MDRLSYGESPVFLWLSSTDIYVTENCQNLRTKTDAIRITLCTCAQNFLESCPTVRSNFRQNFMVIPKTVPEKTQLCLIVISVKLGAHFLWRVVLWWSSTEISGTPNRLINARKLRPEEIRAAHVLARTGRPRTVSWHTLQSRPLASETGNECNLFWLTIAETVSFVYSMLHVCLACKIKLRWRSIQRHV